jgi:hypothetical protein
MRRRTARRLRRSKWTPVLAGFAALATAGQAIGASSAPATPREAGRHAAPAANLAPLATPAPASAAAFHYKDQFLRQLVQRVPQMLKTYDPKTGRFGEGIWLCQDQHPMLPLAVVYATPGEGNPHYKDARLLKVIMRAGDALIDDMDENGQWEFRKKDGSTWGKISMPWTYSRWIRTYSLIRDEMPADRRARWTQAFDRGFSQIEKTQLGHLHNIPTHHAMSLYIAGRRLDRPAWCARATQFLRDVAKAQFEGGYWTEGQGPLVLYNLVYVDALGTYYKLSGDQEVLPAIQRAIRFHRHFTYPSGQAVETIDLRNPYSPAVLSGNPAFTITPEGRAWLQNQWRNLGGALNEDSLALFLLHGEEGSLADPASQPAAGWFVLAEKKVDRAATLRQGLWFLCLSAYTAPVDRDRWHQDRQNLVSIWHEKVGLVLGGGNTKLQPAWSTFTVGQMDLLRHQPGDTNPVFLPRGPLYHIPSGARLVREPAAGLDLTYGPETCRLRVEPRDNRTLEYRVEASTQSGLPVFAHLTLLPRLGTAMETARGKKITLTESPLMLSAAELEGSLTYNGCRLQLPSTATLHWPALPHDPYRKDGRATPDQGRIEIRFPLDRQSSTATVLIEILD